MEEITISCDECTLDGTSACQDCVVTFLLAGDQAETDRVKEATLVELRPKQAVIVDAAEIRAMRLLHSAGLVPTLRFEKRVG
ncbi:MAG TPA: hypothetical protein VGP46_01215 [Acidimicrobiales bacterium]|jgi:hypothetical protein|nr:hypothetical protein [Acidimicrobiales bacterium]